MAIREMYRERGPTDCQMLVAAAIEACGGDAQAGVLKGILDLVISDLGGLHLFATIAFRRLP